MAITKIKQKGGTGLEGEKKRQKIMGQQGHKEIRTLHIDARIVNWCNFCEKWYAQFLKKLKVELPYDPATQLLGICPKEQTVGS